MDELLFQVHTTLASKCAPSRFWRANDELGENGSDWPVPLMTIVVVTITITIKAMVTVLVTTTKTR